MPTLLRFLCLTLAGTLLGACQPNEPAAPGAASPDVQGTPSVRAADRTPPADLAVPEGMVFIPGGTTHIGAEDGQDVERPVFRADVAPFLLDEHPVTVAAFRRFVEATGHVTQAEKFGDSAVLDESTKQWTLRQGTTWNAPLGPDGPDAPDDHPATHVSWNDAAAYCAWDGKRLPTEVEWEHAARGAEDRRDRYAWGDELVVDGRYQANTWQGSFPYTNTGEDGFLYTAPVGEFGVTDLGLTDMGGNVWEWTDSWFRPYTQREAPFTPTEASERVQRGGSFLCNASWCHGFRVSARGHSTPESSHMHVGFRCAKDAS